jgi:DNA primase
MPSRSPAAPGQARKLEEARQREVASLRARLHDEAQRLCTPADWARCLHVAARLPNESFANILLISSQQPGATLVRGYQAWRAIGRQVGRYEQGIEIFSARRPPERKHRDQEPDEHHPSWRDADRVAYVWDVSQTSGPAVPASNLMVPAGEAPAGLWDALCWLARREGFAVEREHGCPDDGATMWTARRIRIRPGVSGQAAAWALAHQLGHVLLHNVVGYPSGTTTSGCAGVRRAEADSVAFIVCARHGITAGRALPHPAAWAGSDPRAQPGAVILATGERITTAAAHITRHLDRILRGKDPSPAATVGQDMTRSRSAGDSKPEATAARADARNTQPAAARQLPEPSESNRRVLADAGSFYAGQLTGSWVPAYLRTRGISDAAVKDWDIGYAPAGWTALTDRLRGLGHDDDTIQAAGLARRSSRGTLIDHFRDRVMLPIHDEHGALAGFIGRAHPDAGPDVPKYLNSPETAAYKKGELLFGLHQARSYLAHGATPVIVEGPFDAIAVIIADPGRLAGLAPCGTALTSQQATALSRAADLPRTGILVAFDSDAAGRKAAIRAHGILLPLTGKLQSALLASKDPAETLQQDGPDALRTILREQTQPLSALIIDASIEEWGRRLHDPEGPLLAMRSTAAVIAQLLPCQTLDDLLRPVADPDLAQIARGLPADTAYQVMRTADALGFEASDVLAEVVNAASRTACSPKAGRRDLHHGMGRGHPAAQATPARLASSSFPHPPIVRQGAAVPAASAFRPPASAIRLRSAQRTW